MDSKIIANFRRMLAPIDQYARVLIYRMGFGPLKGKTGHETH
jgi:hypothetical protein